MLELALDYKKFRRWLEQKYGVSSVYIFIGYVPSNNKLYVRLQKFGYILVYKPRIAKCKN